MSRREPRYEYFAVCAPGAETALASELKAHKFGRVEARRGGARFVGNAAEGWRAVLLLTCAVRVLRQVAAVSSPDGETLRTHVAALPWETMLWEGATIAVDANVKHPTLTHSGYAALVVKDGVVDRMRETTGRRPDVDPRAADVRIFALIRNDRCVLSLDLAGRSLHRRGYRTGQVTAPISESLAAAAIRLAGWDEKSPLLDPFCGSGTILIEAGMKAARIAPGLLGGGYAFEAFPDFDAGRWEDMKQAARKQIALPRKLILRGSDTDPDAVGEARGNVRRAGLEELIQVEVADFADFRPRKGWGATVLSNPPYGIRLEDESSLLPLYREMGEIFRDRCSGYAVHLFVYGKRLAKELALKPERYWPFLHGGLDVRLYRYLIN